MSSVRPFSHEQIQLPSGLKLEASLSVPPVTGPSPSSAKLAICLHPWSWLGGRMDDPVLIALKRPLLESGYHVLRYNSRGVGRSSGWRSLNGLQEAQDAQEVVQWALDTIPEIKSIVIVGYSHGSLIASLVPLLPESTGIRVSHILLSYPLGPRAWLTAFRGAHYTSTLHALLHDPRANVLVIYADADEFTSVASYDAWAEGLRQEASGEGKAELEVVRVEDANHFWSEAGAMEKMLQAVRDWLP